MSEKTIFEKILDKEIPSEAVFENEHIYAFRDISPQAPVHVLVIPKKKIPGLPEISQFSPEEIGSFMSGIAETAKHLGLEKNGYRVVINSGRDGNQTVDYIHAHILGGRTLSWPPG